MKTDSAPIALKGFKNSANRADNAIQGHGKRTVEKIFDPFFTARRKSEGTGLGVSITQGVIEKHKGRIFVESEIGAGTAKTIYVPCDNELGAGNGETNV